VSGIADLLQGFGSGDLFQLLRDGKPRTRSELTELSGFSRSTVSARIDELLASGLLAPVGDAVSTGGRPSARVALNPSARVVAGADFGATHVTVGILDLAGRIMAQRTARREISTGPDSSISWLAGAIRELLEQAGRPQDDLLAVGIGLPGPVEHSSGRPTSPPIMPGWDGFDVPGELRKSIDVDVLVDNDVNVMALGEQAQGWPTIGNMVVIKVSTGIGSGIISGGTLQRGHDGSAGDIGHIAIAGGAGVTCRCGNLGCLEAVAGTPAIISRLGLESVDELTALIRRGDLGAMREVRQAGRDIGEVLNMCVNILNPSVIALWSRPELSEMLIAGIREVVYSRSMPLATHHLTIAYSRVGPDAGVIGAGMLAIAHALSTERIETNGRSAAAS
jgi:predicted NBD/HSP70 family sugar kinase